MLLNETVDAVQNALRMVWTESQSMLDRCYPWGMGVVREEQSNECGKR